MKKQVEYLRDKINKYKKQLKETNEEIDACETVEELQKVRTKRAYIIHHLEVTKDRYSNIYKQNKARIKA